MDDYPLLNLFWTMLWFFLWILWFFLLFRVFGDLFRDDTVTGWGKAGWSVFLILVPFLGVFVYLIARGKGMGEREAGLRARADADFRAYVQQAAGTGAGSPSHADELAKLAELQRSGAISQQEYEQAKAKVLA